MFLNLRTTYFAGYADDYTQYDDNTVAVRDNKKYVISALRKIGVKTFFLILQ